MTEIVMNPLLEVELARDPEMLQAMRNLAEKGAERARSIAPVDTGAYQDSIHADAVIEDGVATGRVFAGTDHWAYVEFGTSDTPAFMPLRRSLEGVGAE